MSIMKAEAKRLFCWLGVSLCIPYCWSISLGSNKIIIMKRLVFFWFLLFSLYCSGQVPGTCYYNSGGRLYTNSVRTLPSGGITAISQCTLGYNGVPYFYSNDSPPVGFLPALGCYLSGGDFYKVACPFDDYVWLLILPLGGVGYYAMRKKSVINSIS